ncbi:MAG TPA: choice-of-anchor Q domain-containing protein [Pyrinomonadaceae bacterium]|nr:choice-of-anchor Q domain-containing protein [Pyrinomonadaceae bacterium]
MNPKVALLLLTSVLVGAGLLTYTQTASSSSLTKASGNVWAVPLNSNLMPLLATTLTVDRTDDTAAASACTDNDNDCSLRGAIIAANASLSGDPVIIELQPATTYVLTLTNASQENAAVTGDLDVTTTLHTVTITGGGSSGPGATIIDASGLTSGTQHDRAFHLTGSGVNVTFQDLVIQNGEAADDGTSGASTNPAAATTNGSGGGILNNGGTLTLTNVAVEQCQALGRGAPNSQPQFVLEARGAGLASLGNGTVVITSSTFSGNTAHGGDGPAGVNNNVGSNAKGGGIYFEGGNLSVEGSRFDTDAAHGGNGGSVDQNGMTNGGFGGLAQGGGVWVGGGTVSINNTTFESTSAVGGNSGNGGNGAEPAGGADGGGVYSLGSTTVSNSTFHLSSATGGRGGDAFGSSCLGAHNAGDGGGARGGAIFGDGGSLVINTATFANNSVTGGNGGDGGQTNGACGSHGQGGFAFGGAVTNNNAATINLKHGTLSLNNAQAGNTGVNQGGANKPARLVAEGTGGGIRVGPAAITLENTIIAANTAANGAGDTTGAPTPGPNVDGTVTSNGHNLIGDATEATGFTGTGDQTGANPMLAALGDNGGPTQTMALNPGSPAIDAGVAAGSSFDQRGKARTYDDPGVVNAATSDGTDIGAFELQPLCTLTCPSDVTVGNDTDECGAVVTYRDPSGTGCGTITCDHPSGSFFEVGETIVTCTSDVGPTCSFKVTVNDTQAPVINVAQSITLWSPDHMYNTFTVANLVTSVSDNCDTIAVSNVSITSVTSDEPDNADADGNTINDIVIGDDCKSVKVRAERKGDSNGRVYTVTLSVSDSSGNLGTATITISVPHSQDGVAAVDDGPQNTVLSECEGG